MKKIVSILMTAVMLLGLFSAETFSSNAYDANYKYGSIDTYDLENSKKIKINGYDFRYRIIGNKSVEIVYGEGFVPAEIEGLPVTIIGQSSYSTDFWEPDSEVGIKDSKLVIPDTVTHICNSAFAGNGISEVVIPDGVVSIGHRAFRDCSGLESVTLPPSLRYAGNSVFIDCWALKEAKINEGLDEISASMFSECFNLSKVSIPASIHTIEDYAFYNCKKLKSVDLSNLWEPDIFIENKAFGYYLDGTYDPDGYEWGEETVMKDFNLIGSPKHDLKIMEYAKKNNIKCTINFLPANVSEKDSMILSCGYPFKVRVDGKKPSGLTCKPKLLKITKDGKVTPLKGGSGYIMGKFSNGKSFKKKISVSDPVIKVKADKGKNKGKYVKTSSITVKRGKTKTVKLEGKAPSIKNKYTNTSYAKIISKKSASKIKIKGIKRGTTTLKIKINGVKTLKLKVNVV